MGMVAASALMLLWSTSAHAQETDVVTAAAELGVTPKTLVVADFTTQEAQTLLAQLDGAATERQALEARHDEATQAAAQLSALREAIKQNPEDSETRQQYETALSDFEAAQTAVESACTALFEAATEGIDPSKVQAIVDCRSGIGRRVPAAFLANDRTEDEWWMIERAVRAERRALRRGYELDPAHEQVLSDVRAEPEVQAARLRLDGDLDAMEAVFTAYQS